MIETDSLLEPTEEQGPCGPGLEYDAAYQELERAVQGKPEQVIGDHVVPAVPPDWLSVRDQAVALLKRSKDLRAAIWLTRALVRLENLSGLAAGLGLIEGLLTRYWQEIHPQPDPEDQDLTVRLNALSSLADNDTLLGDLRAAVLVEASAHERINVRDAEAALGRLAAAGGPGLAQIEAAMRDPSGSGDDALAALKRASGSCNAIRNLLAEKAGTELAPDLKPLSSLVDSLLALGQQETAGQAETEGGAEAGGAPGEFAGVPGVIRSRNEAMRALDAVCGYLEKHEPTNPAPLLIRRAQRLMTMDFVAIIENLVPDSLAQLKNIAGLDKD